MTLFGATLDGAQIASLISLLMVLVFWIIALRGQTRYVRWFRQWEADRKARRDAEIAAEGGNRPPSDTPRGPWG